VNAEIASQEDTGVVLALVEELLSELGGRRGIPGYRPHEACAHTGPKLRAVVR
jgi:hypothetical protein